MLVYLDGEGVVVTCWQNVLENFLLGDSEVRVVIIGMGADVDDPVHVQVQVVELRDLVLLHHLTQARVAL